MAQFLHMQICWKIWIKKTSDLGLRTGNIVEYNNFEYIGVGVTNKCSTMAGSTCGLRAFRERKDFHYSSALKFWDEQ